MGSEAHTPIHRRDPTSQGNPSRCCGLCKTGRIMGLLSNPTCRGKPAHHNLCMWKRYIWIFKSPNGPKLIRRRVLPPHRWRTEKYQRSPKACGWHPCICYLLWTTVQENWGSFRALQWTQHYLEPKEDWDRLKGHFCRVWCLIRGH